jgi:hypothetical protein
MYEREPQPRPMPETMPIPEAMPMSQGTREIGGGKVALPNVTRQLRAEQARATVDLFKMDAKNYLRQSVVAISQIVEFLQGKRAFIDIDWAPDLQGKDPAFDEMRREALIKFQRINREVAMRRSVRQELRDQK